MLAVHRSFSVAFLLLSLLVSPFWASSVFANTKDQVTSIVVKKADRVMYLVSGNEILRKYNIGLGFRPTGDKKISGDGRTPEGAYFIDRKNPNSKYFLSLGISYPNAQDRAEAKTLNKSPGGDIFIHGRNDLSWMLRRDWTAGCISVSNRDIKEIYRLVDIGTPIFIQP